jgi:uncharacterized protein
MPVFETTTELRCPPRRVYEFLRDPANAIRVTPPWLHGVLIDGPPRLEVGSRIRFSIRRFGVRRALTSEVRELVPDRLMRDDQVEGPFRKWAHTHELEPTPAGTRMTDRIEFEPPRGLLGWVVTERFIRRDLARTFAYRAGRFRELLDGREGDP